MSEVVYLRLIGFGIPASLLLSGAAILFFRKRTAFAALQLFGAGGLVVVVLAHVAEVFRLIPSLGWGFPDSTGHYVDLCGVVLGLTAFPIGYFLDSLCTRGTESSFAVERAARL
jgi:hypothetical protein